LNAIEEGWAIHLAWDHFEKAAFSGGPYLTHSITEVSNSNCTKCQMRTYKVTQDPHYDAM